MIKLVVTDMDNTLYSWIDYIVPAVEAMVGSVCLTTGYPRIKVVQSLKKVYELHESNEYPYVLQESSIHQDFPDFPSFDKLVIEPAKAAFSEARRKYLQPYPGVTETLHALKARGIKVVGLTDAPKNPAENRCRKMKFDDVFSALYTLPGFSFPLTAEGEKLISPDIVRKEERGDYRAKCPVIELARECEKPNPEGLLRICREQEVEPKEVLVVGDSLKKDVAVARAVGAVDVWAEYGTYVSREYRERLDIVSAKAITRRHAASLLEGEAKQAPKASYRISNFSMILEVLDGLSPAPSNVTPLRSV